MKVVSLKRIKEIHPSKVRQPFLLPRKSLWNTIAPMRQIRRDCPVVNIVVWMSLRRAVKDSHFSFQDWYRFIDMSTPLRIQFLRFSNFIQCKECYDIENIQNIIFQLEISWIKQINFPWMEVNTFTKEEESEWIN